MAQWNGCHPGRLIDLETHQDVFTWMLQVLAKHKLLDGKTVGIDATTLEANAALRRNTHGAASAGRQGADLARWSGQWCVIQDENGRLHSNPAGRLDMMIPWNPVYGKCRIKPLASTSNGKFDRNGPIRERRRSNLRIRFGIMDRFLKAPIVGGSRLLRHKTFLPLFLFLVINMVRPMAALGADCNSNGVDDLMDIAAGTANDCDTNGVPDDCEIVGGTTFDCDQDLLADHCEPSQHGYALSLDGVGAYVDVGNGFALTNGFTLEAWIQSSQPDVKQVIFTRRPPRPPIGYSLYVQNGKLTFGVLGYDVYETANPVIAPNQWTHVAVAFADNVELFVNGVLIESLPQLRPVPKSSGTVRIGADPFGSPDYWSGFLDEIRVWNRRRLPSEIAAAMNIELPVSDPDLIGYWRFNTGSGSTAVDETGGADGTLTNGAGWFDLAPDCNSNGVPDLCDIVLDTIVDCNSNDIPDECEVDCNTNGQPDACDLASGLDTDCNSNAVPDGCDLASGSSFDCNNTGVLDECEIASGGLTDCNGDGVPDDCELAAGTAADVDSNGVPDACQADCNDNQIPDQFEIAEGSASDIQGDGVPDACIGTVLWFDSFDTYAAGQDIIDQEGGWTGWDANTNAGGLITNVLARSAPNSLAVAGPSDIVHSFDVMTNGRIVVTAWQYLPLDHAGTTMFILLYEYNDGGPYGWSTQIEFASLDSQVTFRNGSSLVGHLPLIKGRWVQVQVVVDFDRNVQTVFYDGRILGSSEWAPAGDPGDLRLDAIDLYANNSSVVFYDNVSITLPKVRDCQDNGIPDECEIAAGTAADTNNNGHIDSCERLIYVDASAQGANDGSSWADAYLFLQDALADANAGGNFTEIHMAAGTYRPDNGAGLTPGDLQATFDIAVDLALRGGYAGASQPDPDARDVAAFETGLTGDLNDDDIPGFVDINWMDNSDQVLVVHPVATFVDIDGVTIYGGGRAYLRDGGGCAIRGASGTIVNSVIRDNGGVNGGGVLCASGGAVELAYCRLFDNHAFGSGVTHLVEGYGGGLHIESSANAVITNSVFGGNIAGLTGGGMSNRGGQNVEVRGCTFINNKGFLGGGGFQSDGAGAIPMITNSIFWQNTNGAIAGSDLPIVRHCIVEGGFPGGVNIIDADPLFVDSNGPDDIVGTIDDDLSLGVGSPAIDAGSNGDVPAGVVTDLDGYPRFNNCAVDMGALEHAVAAPDDGDGDGYTDNCDLCPDTETGAAVDTSGCKIILAPGDCDRNGVIDSADAAGIAGCVFGPSGGLGPGCDCLDFDKDSDADLRDYSVLQIIMGGGPNEVDLINAVLQCANGPNMLEFPAECGPVQAIFADRDGDGDVDLVDFALLQKLINSGN